MENREQLVRLDLAIGLERQSSGTDRPCNQHRLAHDFSGVARELGTSSVDLLYLVLTAEGPKPNSVRSESVGLDELRARRDVVTMDVLDDLRPIERLRVEALLKRDTASIQLRPHCTIGHDRAAGLKSRSERIDDGLCGAAHPGFYRSRAPPPVDSGQSPAVS